MAKLTPISRGDAADGIRECEGNPDHFILSYGNWTACCVEDADLRVTCIVCDTNENCSKYEEFRDVRDLFNLMQLSPALELAPFETTPEPQEPEYGGR